MNRFLLNKMLFALSFLLALPVAGSAQDAVEQVKVLDGEFLHYKYDLATQTVEPVDSRGVQQDIIYNNTNFLGTFFSGANPDERVQDWGTSPGGMVNAFQIGYATANTGGVDMTVFFYQGTTDSDTGNVIAVFELTGLPGSTTGGPQGISVDVDISGGGEFELPAGPVGYSYQTADPDGPLTADGGEGITPFFRVLPDPTNFTFTGGAPANFWMQISGESNAGSIPLALNDECSTATVIEEITFADTIDTREATNNPDDPVFSCNGDGMQTDGITVWYQWTPSEDDTVNLSTDGSNYDTVHGVYTGACGDLTEVACIDVGITDNLVFQATAGVTYFIKVGEFLGGVGGGILVFTVTEFTAGDLFEGPESGTSQAGATVTTDDFTAATIDESLRKPSIGEKQPTPIYDKPSPIKPLAPMGSNYVEDLTAAVDAVARGEEPTKNAPPLDNPGWLGPNDQGRGVPPDPHVAAGPNHIIGTINSVFGIYDKAGNLTVPLIDANQWFANVPVDGFVFDPQVVYDHHNERWIILYISTVNNSSKFHLSVSDDADPTGTWCNWTIPGNQNGSTPTTNLNDFPKMGYDNEALYIMTNQFDLAAGGSFVYTQIKIIPTAQLYANTCDPITWTDFWDLRYPDFPGQPVFNCVPAVTFDTPGVEYLVNVDNLFSMGTFMNLWSITDPTGTPTMNVSTVPVTAFQTPADSDQRGGSTQRIDSSDRRNYNVVYRNGYVYTAHNVAGADDNEVLSRFVRIDPATSTAVEDVAYGAPNHFYIYPAIMVDANDNVMIDFTRSGLNEFASARYTGRLATESGTLQTSALMKAGEANYVVNPGTRNRWGDYMGIAIDPTDDTTFWMFVEFADAPRNTYGTWFASSSFVPQSGPQIAFDPDTVEFDAVEVDSTSLPVMATLNNFGDADLIITDISLDDGSVFSLSDLPGFPASVPTFDGVEFNVTFTPDAEGDFSDTITIASNDADGAVTIPVRGATAPRINLPSTSTALSLEEGQSDSVSFEVENSGGAPLEFDIGFTGVADFTPPTVSAPVATKVAEDLKMMAIAAATVDRPVAEGEDVDAVVESLFNVPAPPSPNALFMYDASTEAGEALALGVGFDGTNFWVTGGGATGSGDPNRLFKYDLNGNLVETFEQGTASAFGWRDLAWDGTFLYGSDSPTIDQIDPTTGAATGTTIDGPLSPNRALAYDPATDHFWTANFSSDIFEIDRAGVVVNQFSNNRSAYGMGWDPSGPYLWVWSQDNTGVLASQFDPVAGTYTGVTFDGAQLPGSNIAGGADFTTDLPTDPANTPVLIGMHQASTDFFVGYLTPPSWLTGANPSQGDVIGGSSQTIKVEADASNLPLGDYFGGVVVGSSDPQTPRSVFQIDLTVNMATSVDDGPTASVPTTFELEQNYPNPFNPETKIRYSLPEDANVTLVIYNVLGQPVRTLVSERQAARNHEVTWDGRSDSGEVQPSGVYVFRLKAGEKVQTRKMLLIK